MQCTSNEYNLQAEKGRKQPLQFVTKFLKQQQFKKLLEHELRWIQLPLRHRASAMCNTPCCTEDMYFQVLHGATLEPNAVSLCQSYHSPFHVLLNLVVWQVALAQEPVGNEPALGASKAQMGCEVIQAPCTGETCLANNPGAQPERSRNG